LMTAIIGHEIMHGYVAYKYGDNTAKNEGRLSINPIIHIDPLGSIVVPLLLFISGSPFLFGWAKPVPVNMWTVMRNGGYNGAIAVSLAGIIYNLFMAVTASVFLGFMQSDGLFTMILYYLVLYNVILAVFNLWPIPPLDGSNALGFLGRKFGIDSIDEFNEKVGRYGMIILIIILATPLVSIFMFPAHLLLSILL
ncbi:MAG TPA: site-2 protease family protein, partial [Campylobacterales bacterium]|nr:site-2 protease family protein [Campylobacterales bacterium]